MDEFMENYVSKEYNNQNTPLEKNGVQRFFWRPIIIVSIVIVLLLAGLLVSRVSF